MKRKIFAFCLCVSGMVQAQNFQGLWKGSITRDYGDETRTDSIHFQLEQAGLKIKGYSIVYIDSSHYIKAAITGDYNASTKMLRLIETSVLENNFRSKDQEIFLDKYVISYDPMEPGKLYGKSISREIKQGYSRSVLSVKK